MIAADMGRLETLEYLLKKFSVDPSAIDKYAIMLASRNGYLNVVERLLQDDRVDPSADDNYAIRKACKNGHLHVVERLLQDDRVDPSADDNYAIRKASKRGYLKIVERLLQDDRVDPSADCNYAIQETSGNGHLDVVERLLLDYRVDPSADDNLAIRVASQNGHLNVVERLLLDYRVDPAARGWSSMRIARDERIVKCLYYRTRMCYVIGKTVLKMYAHIHNENLMVGGLCLSEVRCIARNVPAFLPQDVIFKILSEWTTLQQIDQIDVKNDEYSKLQKLDDWSDSTTGSSESTSGISLHETPYSSNIVIVRSRCNSDW